MSAVLTPMYRDFRRLAKLAEEILRQCGHYERNMAAGGDDDIRALCVASDASQAHRVASRMERRWRRGARQEGLGKTPPCQPVVISPES